MYALFLWCVFIEIGLEIYSFFACVCVFVCVSLSFVHTRLVFAFDAPILHPLFTWKPYAGCGVQAAKKRINIALIK